VFLQHQDTGELAVVADEAAAGHSTGVLQRSGIRTSRTGNAMDARLTFGQLEAGQTWTSPSRTITESDVINFANITGDLNPLHIDHEFARNSPYRQPIAHGLLGLSWVAGLGSQSPLVDTVALVAVRDWEFIRPLYFGDTVHVRTTILEKQPNARRHGRVIWKQQLVNQQGEIAQQGIFETLVRVQPALAAPHFEAGSPAAPGSISGRE
jgi:acyl dehydratase